MNHPHGHALDSPLVGAGMGFVLAGLTVHTARNTSVMRAAA